MNEEVRLSRLRISRRRALSIGGTVGMSGVLAACGSGGTSSSATATTTTAAATAAPVGDVEALLAQAGTCSLSKEQTQGPYWFDVDNIRGDIREGRPGTQLTLALRVQDVSACSTGGAATAVPNSVVEIWHCDAGGSYSGFESGSAAPAGGGAPPSGGPPSGAAPGGGAPSAAGGETSNGSYSVGDTEAQTTDDGTYLRGAQVADAKGIVRFTTIYPGWYRGRTTHIHCKVHVDKKTVLTTQLFFDDTLTDAAYTVAPYSDHTGRDTRNDGDSIFDKSGLLTVARSGDAYLAALNLGVDA